MKSVILLVLVFAVLAISGKPDRYYRPGPINPTVCNKGDSLRNVRCWRPCPKGWSIQWNNWFRCQKNCFNGDRSIKGRCYSTRCVKGYRRAGGRCYQIACPRNYVPLNAIYCQTICRKPYVARGRKCVNPRPRPGQCDSYTRPTVKRHSRPFITYPQRTIPRGSYYPRCRPGWDMFGRKCRGPCKKGYRKVGVWCKNNICFTNKHKYKRAGPINPHVCPRGWSLRNVRCWRNCPGGWFNQWNNWFRCQRNCLNGDRHIRGVCYSTRCVKGYRRSGGRCYLIACPRFFVPLNAQYCQQICRKPYVARGRKCVNPKPLPGQCDSFTRPTRKRASRPFIRYPATTAPKPSRYPGCPGGWRMERGKCRKLCRPGFTIIGGICKMTKCIGI